MTISPRLLQLYSAVMFLTFGQITSADTCITLVTAGGGHDYWNLVEKGGQKAADELGVSLFVRGATEETNITGQAQVLDLFEEKRCVGLVLAPNANIRADYTESLRNQGLPTVFIDRDVGGVRVSVVKTDNYQAGFKAASSLVDRIKNNDIIAILHPGDGIVSTSERVRGFTAGIASHTKNLIEVYDVGATVGEARSNAKNLLREVNADVFFTPNLSTTLGLLLARDSITKSNILHFGFDTNEVVDSAIQDGRLYGVVVQDPFFIGYKGVKTVYTAATGGEVTEKIDSPIRVIFSPDYLN